MSKDSINEMEQIQRGLEQFLEKEIEGYKKTDSENAEIIKDKTITNDLSEEKEEEIKLDMLQKSGKPHKSNATIVKIPHPVKEQDKQEEEQEEFSAKSNNKKTISNENKNSDNNKKDKRKKKSKLKKILLIIIILLFLLAAIWYFLINYLYGKVTYEEIDGLTTSPITEEGVTNILLIGNDSRKKGEDGRSDAMILLSISNKTKTIYMTSLLRDMYVDIPGYKSNRLNASFSYGGPELLLETIEQNFDIEVNRYALVNFQAFANLIDSVGGVNLELTTAELEYVNGYLVEYNMLEGRPEGTDYMDTSQAGKVHLNGPQTLAYCRNRYIGSDFARTERQRKVLEQVFKQMPKAVLTNMGDLIEGILPNLITNLTEGEILGLSLQVGKLITYNLIQNSIPIEGSYKNASIRGMSVLEVDFDTNNKFIRENIYGEIQKENQEDIQEEIQK